MKCPSVSTPAVPPTGLGFDWDEVRHVEFRALGLRVYGVEGIESLGIRIQGLWISVKAPSSSLSKVKLLHSV